MAFRRRDEWDEFLKRHGPELRMCGVPDDLTADRMRFFVFLDHGYDDWGRVLHRPSTPWNISLLAVDQATRLAEFLGKHFPGRYPVLERELRRTRAT